MTVDKVLPVSLLALALTASAGWMSAQADSGAATPSADQSQAATMVFGVLSDSRYAYRPRELNDALSAEIYKRYLEALDGGKLYFTAADVARFEAYRSRLDDAIRSGEIGPAFEIFSVYQTRAAERVAYARALLKQDAVFRFDTEDRWQFDREKAPWAKDQAELDALWKQYVRNDWLRLKLAGKQPDDIRKTLDKRYANLAKSSAELNANDAFQLFLNAYATSIDPHTDYFDPRAAERFEQSMSLKLEGIGAQLVKQDDVVVIRELIPGGPAMLSQKLKAGDRIVGVGQAQGPMEDVVGWRIDDVVDKIKGGKGTQVRLDIVPAEAVLDSKPVRITLTRAEVRLEDQKAKGETLTLPAGDGMPARRIGVIKLPAFYEDFEGRRRRLPNYASSSRDVERLLQQFRADKVDGVVIDLRNNGGGSLDEAVAITGLFIDRGPVVQQRISGGEIGVAEDERPGVVWEGPLAVLINRGSASASEIFAGAIQDYGRGLIIGETTFGKGTVQSIHDLDRWPPTGKKRYGQVKLTVAQFFLPGGSSTQNKGVVPDIAFPASVDASEFGESMFDNALPWTSIRAMPHTRYGDFSSLLPRLRSLHDARVAKDKEFQWWSEDVALSRELQARTWISLNESERRAERDRDVAKRKQRQEERRTLGLDLDPFAEDDDDGLTAAERDIRAEAAREKDIEKRPDPLLRESAAILADAMRVLGDDQRLTARVLPETRSPLHWAD